MSMSLLFRVFLKVEFSDGGGSGSLSFSLSRASGSNLGFELRADLQDFILAWREAVETISLIYGYS